MTLPQVINARAALLSNYEVLSLLRELESDNLARTKIAHRIKKEEEASGLGSTVPAGGGKDPTKVDAHENLRTVCFEAIQYLSSEFQPTAAQTPEAITQLVKSLEPYGLTKAEKLQIVNLAPRNHVELYVIVEELEDRLAERMGEVISGVEASLVLDPALPVGPQAPQPDTQNPTIEDASGYWEEDDGEYNGEEFDDQGGDIEGDLDMEEE
ncbi:RNA polymerase Rpb4-domain-containing protein [Mycena pura]|uniref:DNA-directed RNA polymerase III subunit RPC9 n=1 Tax=Mycena pura TaxID=153505 RepID=A0AAD6V3M7_9AGAR|nr:RNA polymerase Rpb4-domain-containing protein [Mycena pura]